MSDIPEFVVPETRIIMGGKERVLRYDLLAFKAIHEATGKDPLEDPEVLADFSPKGVNLMLWAALANEKPRPTMDEVASWVPLGIARVLAAMLRQALADQMPEPREDSAPADPTESASDPTSGSSGPTAPSPSDGPSTGSEASPSDTLDS
jgi:hypothetical protein